jgi:thiol-disulfide isomerase/thioredoxin
MNKAMLPFAIGVLCFGAAFHYFLPGDFSWAALVSDGHSNLESTREPLPSLTLPDLERRPVELASYKGQVLYVTLWATWCGYCVQEVPQLIHLQNEYQDRGFTVLAVAVDDNGPERVEEFVHNRRFFVDGESRLINYPVVFGTEASARTFGFHGLPVGMLVDRQGREVKIVHGLLRQEKLASEIEKLLR